MASVEQVIKHLLARVEDLEKRLALLEAASDHATDEWAAEIDVDLDDLEPGERAQVEAARQRLERDKGGEVESDLDEAQVKIDVGVDGSEAWFPVATEEQIKTREALMGDVGLEELAKHGLAVAEAQDAWIKGGPLWLHAYDRDLVMSLPLEIRRAFVLDAMLSSTRDSQELGRDILKDESPGTPDITVEALGR